MATNNNKITGSKILSIIGKLAGIFALIRSLMAAFETFQSEYGKYVNKEE